MTWTAVNSSNFNASATAVDGEDRILLNISDLTPDLDTASGLRDYILNAAERLASSVPKRKRRASTVITQRALKKVKQAKKKATPVGGPKVTKFLRSSKTEKPSPSHVTTDCTEDIMRSVAAESVTPIVKTPHMNTPICSKSTSEEPISNTEPNIIEIPSDESQTFSDLDDSIFTDEIDFGAALWSTPATTVSTPEKQSKVTPCVSDMASTKRLIPHQDICRPTKVQPMTPFMHPCLLEALDATLIPSTTDDMTGTIPKHTCFRLAELLRLSKALKQRSNNSNNDLVVQVFVTVREVKYANTSGRGQGLVFGDIFFPDKPPHVFARSGIPYSKRNFDTFDDSYGQSTVVWKAHVQCHIGKKRQPLRQLTLNKQVSTIGLDSIKIDEFEVVKISQSSWGEIAEIKDMIDKDMQAKLGKTKKCQPIPGFDGISSSQGDMKLPSTEKSDLEDFDDFDFDLPDLLDVIRRS